MFITQNKNIVIDDYNQVISKYEFSHVAQAFQLIVNINDSVRSSWYPFGEETISQAHCFSL